MNPSRREFLKTGTLAVAGAALLSPTIIACKGKNEILGVQLYCVREDMKNDPLETLKALAEMGYRFVEHANYVDRKFYGYTAIEFKKVLNDLGLKMPSGHTVMGKDHWDETKKDFTDTWKYTIEDAATMGQEYVISPWMDQSFRNSYDNFAGLMEIYNKCGELCQQSGMKFGYHNHDFEFSEKLNNTLIFDLIMEQADPDKVVLQLDIGNMYIAGAKALDIVNKYPGRFENIHVKDMIRSESEGHGYESTILGEGLVNSKEVADLARGIGGTRVFIIEQESYQGKTPLECMKEDLAIMKSWGY